MLLKETALICQPESGPHVPDFNWCASVVTEGYDEARSPVQTAGTAKLVVNLWTESMPQTFKAYNEIEPNGKYGNVVDELNAPFDLSEFLGAEVLERRRLLLDHLQNNVIPQAVRRGWPVEPFATAYSTFVRDGLRPRWTSRSVSSPSKSAIARVEGEFDEKTTWITVVVESTNGEIIARSDHRVLAHRGLAEVRTMAAKIRWSNDSAEVIVESRPYRGFTEPAYPPFVFRIPGLT